MNQRALVDGAYVFLFYVQGAFVVLAETSLLYQYSIFERSNPASSNSEDMVIALVGHISAH